MTALPVRRSASPRSHRPEQCTDARRGYLLTVSRSGRRREGGIRWLAWAHRHDTYHFLFASGFTTSRAHSIKSCATGLSVRPFRVLISVGHGVVGKSMGNALRERCLRGKCNSDSGSTARRRPASSKILRRWLEAVVTIARGASSPFARKASTTADPKRESGDTRIQGPFASSTSSILRRRAHGLVDAATTTI